MKHGKKFNHLGRKSAHRKATLMNLANALIVHKRIKTTVAKAKALRQYVEPLITKSKNDTTHSRRVVFSYLKDKEAVTELFREVSQKVMNRQGGYTRIIKLEPRLGDNAELCYIELVDYNENLLTEKSTKKTTRRRKRTSAKKETTPEATATVATEDKDAVKDEVVEETSKVEDSKVDDAEAKTAPKAKEKKVEAKADDTVKEEKPKAEKETATEPEAKTEEASEPKDQDDKKEVSDEEKSKDDKSE